MKGRRLTEPPHGLPAAGDFWNYASGWHGSTPNGHLCNLAAHTVIELDGGNITVTPSIKVSDGSGHTLWHGYLTEGVWIQC